MLNIDNILEQNHEATEDSFLWFLHERNTWNYEKYWELDFATVVVTKKNREQEFLNKETCRTIAFIYIKIITKIISHYNKNDGYIIKNVSDEEIFDLREKVEIRFEGFFSGSVLEEMHFEKKNPLLTS